MTKTRLVIRAISAWGVPNIRTWEPPDPKQFAEVITLNIGFRANSGSDIFSIRVATPAGLGAMSSKNGVIATRPLLIVDEYDYENLAKWLEATVAECDSEVWTEAVEKLRRYFDWEFDGYSER